MTTDSKSNIKISPILSRLVQPPSKKELEEAYAEYSAVPTKPIIHTWHGTHLNDQYLHELCIDKNIPFYVSELFFENLKQAVLYICSCQLKRKNLTHEYRKYIIGQEFGYLTQDTDESKQSDSKYTIASSLGHELYLSAGTVLKYYSYSDAINVIFDQNPEFAGKILMGKHKFSNENLLELSRLMPEEIKAVSSTIMRDNPRHITLSYIRNEAKWSHIQPRAPQSRREKKEQKISKHAAIRQMPEYDPDSEVNSLCMTIDSWNSSIERVYNSSKFAKITDKARLLLMKKLSLLEHTVNIIQESLCRKE